MFDWHVVNKPLILYEMGIFIIKFSFLLYQITAKNKQRNVPFRKNISLTNYSSVQATECIIEQNSQVSVINMPQVDLICKICCFILDHTTSHIDTPIATMQFLHNNLLKSDTHKEYIALFVENSTYCLISFSFVTSFRN